MKKLLILLFASLLFTLLGQSQGCVIVRNISGFGQYNLTDNAFTTTQWQLNITNRYFKSFRDFKGTDDQKTPGQNQSINHVFSTDIVMSRFLSKGWSIDFSLPVTSNSRTTSAEHGGINTPRHTTHSFGIGDIRIIGYKWLLQPMVKQKVNVQVGFGIKLPTGDYKYEDYFYRNDTTKVLAPVNASVQLGDGGTGLVTEVNTFYIFNKTVSLYGNFYYLMNPREQNGTSTTAGRTPTVYRSNPEVSKQAWQTNFQFGPVRILILESDRFLVVFVTKVYPFMIFWAAAMVFVGLDITSQ